MSLMMDNSLSGGKSNEEEMRGEKRERDARLGRHRVFSRSQNEGPSGERERESSLFRAKWGIVPAGERPAGDP